MKEGVPTELRNRALRKLWRVNPVFGHLDGLNDYDGDFTDAATVVKGLKTLYKVGPRLPSGAHRRTRGGAAAPIPSDDAPAAEEEHRMLIATAEPAEEPEPDRRSRRRTPAIAPESNKIT